MKNVQEYLIHKNKLKEQEFTPRENCSVCGFAKRTCYCHLVKSFDSKIVFAILIHQIEIDRKIATGTLSHLILENSYLINGYDYSEDEVLNELIENPKNHCVILYPGTDSLNLSELSTTDKKGLVPKDKQLVIIVIDGTWRTARQSMYLSQNLIKLPKISFNNDTPSNFRIRKQPSFECCSTVEAVHKTINLLGDSQGFDVASRVHDNLLDVFDSMVDKQIYLTGTRTSHLV
jgi:DTW domain-containing protein YfiP